MVLHLHVWGPAFGLPSLDPECLAVIAYFTQALDKSEWTLVRSSPSAVPTHCLPALHDPTTPSSPWTAGLTSILSHLRTNPPATFRDPDADLPPSARGRVTAYTAHLTSSAARLLALSLYASSANWSAATRPAYSAALPFPLGWTEVSPVRRAWLALAEGLGIDLLDAEDAEAPKQQHKDDQQHPDLPDIARSMAKKGISSTLTPEQKARIRLEGLVAETLDVLADLKGHGAKEKKWFLSGDEEQEGEDGAGPTSLDCVAFGYLALMICPDLPRPWLRDILVARYPGLQAFVNDMTSACLGDGLPVVEPAKSTEGVLAVTRRFADGAVRNIPGVGEEWRLWRDGGKVVDLLLVLGGGLGVAALVAGFVFRQRLPILGLPVQRWARDRSGLRAFGAAGALFGFSQGGGGGGGSDEFATEVNAPFDGKVNGVEVAVSAPVL